MGAPDLRPEPAALARLRRATRAARTAPRIDLGDACAVCGPGLDPDRAACLLAQALHQALRDRPRLRPPGTTDTSFDEDWLLALRDAITRGDRASERFLLARRCHKHRAPLLAALLRQAALQKDGACPCTDLEAF